MDNRMGLLLMQIDKSLKNLNTPALDNSEAWMLYLLHIFPQTTTSDHLSNEDDLFLLLVDPGRYEMDDVFMLQLLDQVYF